MGKPVDRENIGDSTFHFGISVGFLVVCCLCCLCFLVEPVSCMILLYTVKIGIIKESYRIII